MKTKLLKKVRKRYSIVRVDKIDRNADSWRKSLAKDWGYPFFILKDHQGYYLEYAEPNYDKAIDRLSKIIRNEYAGKMKKKTEVSTKVWYNDKK